MRHIVPRLSRLSSSRNIRLASGSSGRCDLTWRWFRLLRYPYHQPASRWPSGGFAELTKRKLRRSAYRSVTDLETGIRIRTPACSSRSELKSAGRHYLSGWCGLPGGAAS